MLQLDINSETSSMRAKSHKSQINDMSNISHFMCTTSF